MQKHESKFGLGDELQDVVTGFKGFVLGISFYSTGCVHYGLAPKGLKDDGDTKGWSWFDEQRVKSTGKKVVFPNSYKAAKKKTSGSFPNPPSI